MRINSQPLFLHGLREPFQADMRHRILGIIEENGKVTLEDLAKLIHEDGYQS